jgi:CspA family cold shock protein
MTGTVKWFDAEKGYDYIAPDSGGSDLYVQFSEIVGRRSLEANERVRFEIGRGDTGPQATGVQVI